MPLFSFALQQLQLYCHALGWPRSLHRKPGAGANGAYQLTDPVNQKLFHVYITFSLEIPKQLNRGIIIPGIGVRCNILDTAEDDNSLELSDEEDNYSWELSDDCYFEDPEDDPFEDLDDSMDCPAAFSSTSLSAL